MSLAGRIFVAAVHLWGWFAAALMCSALIFGGHVSLSFTGDAYSEELVETLKSDEGFSATIYTDTAGNRSIGYGYNLEAGMVEADADYLVRSHLDRSVEAVRRCWPPFDDQPIETRSALLDLDYQVGDAGLCDFDETLGALARGDCDAARQGILGSLEAQQTPGRGRRIAAALCP